MLSVETLTKLSIKLVFLKTLAKFICSVLYIKAILSQLTECFDNPIFGHGWKLGILCSHDEYNYDVNSCSTHPHNTYVQLLAETGLVGVIFVIFLLFYLIIIMIKQVNSYIFENKLLLSDYQICLIACFIITLWPITPTNNFFNNWMSIVYYLPIGFYLHSIYSINNND